ncbi:hypothetical protein [Pseudomonas veronii]|uniref:hypothetical protein n=1 Tax=Pseudomonas veronii TaxID=76761 RepID=UPI0021BE4331|nr:hypothetical protein [Pseudomonas veronii]MCT9825995.1 hypothetical protein [Pseudomonas veronii]
MTTESLSHDLAALVKAVPTLHLTPGELEGGAPAIFAGNDPVFRCRSTDLGHRYAALAVMAFERLAAGMEKPVAGASSKVDQAANLVGSAAMHADLAQSVSAILSLQPELASKVPMWTKLVVAAVTPFMAGAESAGPEFPSSGEVAVARDKPKEGPHKAIHGFISWLADSGKPGEQFSLERLAELAGEWEATYA